MVAIIDRLIADETRKRNGEFFTPTIWVNEAHKMISETFGEDWKEKYVVWDCAWGTGNLSRDYNFKELYCSTLRESDIQTANQMKINMNSTKFVFDFLNDDLELLKGRAPVLWKALEEGREILFFINPPYGTANEAGAKGEQKAGMALTKMNELMKNEDWGASSQQLYAQFLYRITKIKQQFNCNTKIGLFSPPLFLSGGSYKKFREKFFNNFRFENGYLINAANFADVSDWGLSFSIWNNGIENRSDFNFTTKKLNTELNIVDSSKIIYNIDNNISFSDWIKRNIKKEKTFDVPQMSSSLSIKKDGIGNFCNNAIGYFFNIGNNVMKNNQEVYILSSTASSGHGISILPINFLNIVSNFTSRRLITGQYVNWVNWYDEYIAPSEATQSSPEYLQWNTDAIVYSLFNSKSNQSSMRQVEYKDKLWDIKNEFFWMSKEEMMQLAEENYFDELYQDARNSENRYVYNLLQNTQLSPDAQEVLDMATELVKKSFKMRKMLNEEHPEWHLHTWDAGFYQIKKILNEYFKEDLKEFTIKYKLMESRLREGVYKFGFLK